MRIFVALIQYFKMPRERYLEIATAIGKKNYKAFWMEFHPEFEESMVRMINENPQHKFRIEMIRGDYIDKGRSKLLGIWHKLLTEGDVYDYLFMVDEDVSWDPDAINLLINAGRSVIGATYTFKIDKGPKAGMPVSPFLGGETIDQNGLLKILWLNGGFVLVHKDALLHMIVAFPELRYERNPELEGDMINMRQSWALWMHMVYRHRGHPVYLGEDYAFCQRARQVGFDIWCHTGVKITHWDGAKAYHVDWDKAMGRKKEIPGWMSEEELAWLWAMAVEMDSVAEIGCWKGKSTKALLSGCMGPVYAIDHFKGTPGHPCSEWAKDEDVYAEFIKNVGHFKNLKVIKMDSLEASQSVLAVDMVFIDGDHSYGAVKRDIELWLPKCKKLICGHDYNEVWRAVHDTLGKITGIYESIWFKRL